VDDVTQEMVDAFHTAWAATHPGLPGDRTRAGLDAALDVYMGSRNLELARQHDESDAAPVLYGTVQFVETITRDGDVVHLCRDYDGNLLVNSVAFGTSIEVAAMDEQKVRWLAGVLAAVLDNWPRP
jgi:hypothetical protein